MKAIPTKNAQGIRLEYNPCCIKDVCLAVAIAKYWYCRGATDNQLIAVFPTSDSISLLMKYAA